jgi:hypothetical protein
VIGLQNAVYLQGVPVSSTCLGEEEVEAFPEDGVGGEVLEYSWRKRGSCVRYFVFGLA